ADPPACAPSAIAGKQLARRQHRACNHSHTAQKTAPGPPGVESHKICSLTNHFLTTAAMQLISTSESPGSAATATVVRAGPPWGKYVENTLCIPSQCSIFTKNT